MNKYCFISRGRLELRNKPIYLIVQNIENKLNEFREHKKYSRYFIQIKAMLGELNELVSRLGRYNGRKLVQKIEKEILELEKAVIELERKFDE